MSAYRYLITRQWPGSGSKLQDFRLRPRISLPSAAARWELQQVPGQPRAGPSPNPATGSPPRSHGLAAAVQVHPAWASHGKSGLWPGNRHPHQRDGVLFPSPGPAMPCGGPHTRSSHETGKSILPGLHGHPFCQRERALGNHLRVHKPRRVKKQITVGEEPGRATTFGDTRPQGQQRCQRRDEVVGSGEVLRAGGLGGLPTACRHRGLCLHHEVRGPPHTTHRGLTHLLEASPASLSGR